MQRILVVALIGLIFILNSCQSADSLKVGFLYTSPDTERYVKESNYFKDHGQDLGVEVIVEHGQGDEAKQYEKALEMFDMGINALTIISVNANTAAAIVREGHRRGVKVIAYNRLIKNCDLDLYIAGDNKALGKTMVGEILKVKDHGKAIILGGDKYDRNAVEMHASIKNELQPLIDRGDIEILYETFIEDWSDTNAAFELNQYLSFTGQMPDMIFAGYDGIADACVSVLKEHGVETPVYITGQDAEMRGVRNILAGKQQMTAFHPLKKIAEQSVELIVKMLRDEKEFRKANLSITNNGQKDVPTLKVASIAVTKENLDKVLIEESGFYTKEEVYNN